MTEAARPPPRGGLPPHSSLITPRPQKTVPLPHNLSYLHGDFPRSMYGSLKAGDGDDRHQKAS